MASRDLSTRRESWLHRLPRSEQVEKDPFLKEYVAGKSVIHVGFWGLTDAERREAFEKSWLHRELAETARELIGIDADEQGVKEATAAGYRAYRANCQDIDEVRTLGFWADLVLAGELIEHLDCPGRFLQAMHLLSNRLVLTTPNGPSFMNFALALVNREAVNPDHMTLFSWYTLTNILARNGWITDDVLVYNYPPLSARGDDRPARSLPFRVASSALIRMQRMVPRWSPFTNYGLIVLAHSEQERTERTEGAPASSSGA